VARQQRRREARKQERASDPPGLFGRREVIAVVILAVGVVGVVAGATLFSGGGDEDTPPAGTVAPVFSPSNADEAAIESLARRSIEALPQGQWASLYDDFTTDFHARCAREQFVQGGQENATQLGESLSLIAYKNLEEMNVTGDTASVVIVGEVRGQSEYRVRTSFRRVDGIWKLTPEPATEGCQAFTRLSG
jgi:hypothetical protein